MRNSLILAIVGIFAVAAASFFWRRPTPQEAFTEEHDKTASFSVGAYRPQISGSLADLSTDAGAILQGIPGVAKVERRIEIAKPTARIVHFCLDIETSQVQTPPPEQRECIYLSPDQATVLGCLAKHHSVKAVFVEGVTQEGAALYDQNTKNAEPLIHQLGELHDKLREARKLIEESSGERRDQAKAREYELIGMIGERSRAILEFGPTSRLPLAVLPLDDLTFPADLRPTRAEARPVAEPEQARRRGEAIVKTILDRGSFGFVLLRGTHDLGPILRERPGTEYLRVWPRSDSQ